MKRKCAWFPSAAFFLLGGYVLQGFKRYKLFHQYNQADQDSYSSYISIINLLLHPLEMFYYGHEFGDCLT